MKKTKRFWAMLLTLVLCMGEFASTGGEVYAVEEDEETVQTETEEDYASSLQTEYVSDTAVKKTMANTILGSSGMADPKVPKVPDDDWNPWSGSFVYYGTKNYVDIMNVSHVRAIKYRVLDKRTTDFNQSGNTEPTMLLDCDYGLIESAFAENYGTWENSIARNVLNGESFLMGSILSDTERGAIATSYKSVKNNKDGQKLIITRNDTQIESEFQPLSSSGDKVFLLDAVEVMRDTYGYVNDPADNLEYRCCRRKGTFDSIYNVNCFWYLRTPEKDNTTNNTCAVNEGGRIRAGFTPYAEYLCPAFNLDLSKVLFATAENDKNPGELDAEYKLTLKTVSINTSITSGEKVTVSRNKVTIPYSISGSGKEYVNALTVLILDKEYQAGNTNNASVKYYGQLDVSGSIGSSGSARFNLPSDLDPEKWGSDYRVYILAEQQNGLHITDYASAPTELTVSNTEISTIESYNVWVGNTQFDEDNLEIACGDGYASFDPVTNTLTFNDATITGTVTDEYSQSVAVYSCIDDLSIEGSADLSSNTGDIAIESLSGKITFKDADLQLMGKYYAIKADELVFDGGNIKAVSTVSSYDCDAIYAKDITLNKGKVETEIEGQFADSIHAETITVNGGLLDALCNGGFGKAVYVEKSLVLNGGEINANAFDDDYAYGICGKSNGTTTLAVNGGKIYSSGSYSGIQDFNGGITLAEGVVITKPEGGKFDDDKTKVVDKNGGLPSEVEITEKKYTVTYNMNGHGTAIDPVVVKAGQTVDVPDDEAVEGYTFDGWFTDADCTTAYVFTTPVNEDITLYAGWKGVDRSVTFDMGGKAANVTANVENGQPVSRPATDPEAEGYIFTGWFEDEDCTTEYDFTRVITKNTRIFAGWRETAKYTVAFSANKVEATNMPADKTVEEGKPVTKPAADPTADGYAFTGWYADAACTTAYTFTEPVKENSIIYAGWKEVKDPAKGVTVSFNMMDHGTAIPAQTVSENGKVEQPDHPAEEGWVFGGWFKDKELTEIYDFDTPVTADMILYAKWYDKSKVTVYTVSFNLMDHGTDIKPVEVVSGNVLPIPKSPVEEGWKFEGWFKEEGCVNEYNFNDPVKENFTLYAKWTEEKDAASKGISALDNRPVIDENTTDIYLVKGQKFYIGKEWAVADKVVKTYVSIDKKGYLKAKKPDPESVTVKIKKEGRADITVHICQPALSDKKKTLEITNETPNPTYTLTITKDNGIKNVLWYSAAPDVATVDQNGKVTAVAKGKAKITAYVNGKAYNCNITVKESVVAKNRTLHVNLQGSKKISVKGVKNWIGADETIAEKVNNADKFKAMKVGKTVLSTSVNDIKYTIDFYAEDITVNGEKVSGGYKNKYTIDNMQVGTATDISLPGVKQDVVFKSSKPDVVFIDEKGHIEARSKGKAKLTTKINGKTITITVSVVD